MKIQKVYGMLLKRWESFQMPDVDGEQFYEVEEDEDEEKEVV